MGKRSSTEPHPSPICPALGTLLMAWSPDVPGHVKPVALGQLQCPRLYPEVLCGQDRKDAGRGPSSPVLLPGLATEDRE